MATYHFFKHEGILTYLDTSLPSYSGERQQLLDQGFVALTNPIKAQTPSQALGLLRSEGEFQQELGEHSKFELATSVPIALAGLLG
ncbi:hypothetical protein [Aeromonas cavernicola]|uniref:Uncharacterized protein n=1 Tax=Aeromonas cavernicola TaxID=1006623 RepID=A0A2H9U3H0_9GAMM|nr:hypothetical protein [Aeromonas cavernicola]PJG58519.1 hypothetical protein CUC53_12110 [Aeromonas cavernicola]